MFRQHHRLNGHKLEQTLGDTGGEGSLACCNPKNGVAKSQTQLSDQTATVYTILTFPLPAASVVISSLSYFVYLGLPSFLISKPGQFCLPFKEPALGFIDLFLCFLYLFYF